jgi:hypothetical protein
VAQGVGPEFKPQYCKKTKKENKEEQLASSPSLSLAETWLQPWSHFPSPSLSFFSVTSGWKQHPA